MAFRDYLPAYRNEYPKDHPKWFGVPAKGEVTPVNRDLIVIGLIIIIFEIFIGIFLTTSLFQIIIISIVVAITISIFLLWYLLWKDKQIKDTKYPFVIQIFFIIILEICIWAVYRNLTADYFDSFGSMRMYAFHIVFAPTIHLIPIILAWKLWWGEKGLPFQFSKKLIMSGVIIGFSAAIIWRLLQEFSYVLFAGAAGGTHPDTFTFLNFLETPALFGIMSFVHFCVVGPVEELEFRGFAQDQAARVLPNWQAVTFSSVLFGSSHIPIAIFLYQFPPQIFTIALIGWISAGFVFGFLYMWSRSIWAVIVMHGMGNWQLSVYYFQSDSVAGWSLTGGGMVVEIFLTLLVDVIMIFFFYFIFKYYWEPHRRGEPAFNGAFLKLQDYIHKNDFKRETVFNTKTVGISFGIILIGIVIGLSSAYELGSSVVGVMVAFIVLMVVILFLGTYVKFSLDTVAPLLAFIVLTCGIFVGLTSAFGTPYYPLIDAAEEGGGVNLDSFVESVETRSGSGTLQEGQSETMQINSLTDKYIKEISVTITWTDEPDRDVLHTNEPDEFEVFINGGNKNESGSTFNTQDGQGTVQVTLLLTHDEIKEIISNEGNDFSINVNVTLITAGDQEPMRPRLRSFPDDQNHYVYSIDITYLIPE